MAKDDDKGLAKAPAPQGLGQKQQEEAKLASTNDLLRGADNPLEEGEGVGTVRAYVNPEMGDAVELNTYDDDGNVSNTQTFKRGKVHLVTEELANSPLFIRADDKE